MNKKYLGILLFIVVLSSCASSRPYRPEDEIESSFYTHINKNIWPDDIRDNGIENYCDDLVGWVGIANEYNVENNVVLFTMTHHYYDWIEDTGYIVGPYLLSPDGEGYIMGEYVLRPDITQDRMNEFVKDFIGDCIVIYGYPKEILDNGTIVIDTEYARRISKKFVNPSWIAPGFKKYGRNGLE